MINEMNIYTAAVANGTLDISDEYVKSLVREELTGSCFKSYRSASEYRRKAGEKIVKRFGEYCIMTDEEYSIYKKAMK